MDNQHKNSILATLSVPTWVALARDYLDGLRRLGAVRGSIAASEESKKFISEHGLSGNSLQRAVSALEFLQTRYPGLLERGEASGLQLAKVELLKRLDATNSKNGDRLIDSVLKNKISLRELRRIHAQNLDATPTELLDRRSNTKLRALQFDKAVFDYLAKDPSLVGATSIERPSPLLTKIRHLQIDAEGPLEDGTKIGVMTRYLAKEDSERVMLDSRLPLSVYFAASKFALFLLVIPDHTDIDLDKELRRWLHDQCGEKVRVARFDEAAGKMIFW